MKKWIKLFASLKLAIFILVTLSSLLIIGTLIESYYNDAHAAQILVYRAWYMWTILSFLAINLIAVMVDRWPWKPRHSGFVLAHVGILFLLLGSVVTYFYGIDGSMRFGIGNSNRFVTVPETDVVVYASMDGDQFVKLFDEQVEFRKNSPTLKKPYTVPMAEQKVEIIDYLPYAIMDTKIMDAKIKEQKKPVGAGGHSNTANRAPGAAVRFQLSNDFVNLTKWLVQPKRDQEVELELGPMVVTLTNKDTGPSGQNKIVLYPDLKTKLLVYVIYSKDSKTPIKKGSVSQSDVVSTGWMNLKLRILTYYPQAKQEITARAVQKSSDLTRSAIKLRYKGQEHWLSLNSRLRFFSDKEAYLFFYQNRRLPLSFSLKLKDFQVGHYQGTRRAASYSSLVEVLNEPEGDTLMTPTLISMNEPLKYGGFTFYQASFEKNDKDQPVASILSVNYDPGRFFKYFGSFLIVLGIICMFYFKRTLTKALS